MAQRAITGCAQYSNSAPASSEQLTRWSSYLRLVGRFGRACGLAKAVLEAFSVHGAGGIRIVCRVHSHRIQDTLQRQASESRRRLRMQ